VKLAERHPPEKDADNQHVRCTVPREKQKGENLKVLHHMVGPWPRDHVLTVEQIRRHSEDVDIERLLALEAVEWTDEDPTGVPPPGPENREILVDGSGRVLDAHGFDRPDVAARVPAAEKTRRAQEMQEGIEASAEEEGDPEDTRNTDIRSRPGNDLTQEATGEDVDYNSLRAEDLRKDATGRGIEGADRMRKSDLVKALQAHDEENSAPE
jgi:hypothetical protein